MIKQYVGQLYVETPWGGYWEDCGGGYRSEEDSAFADVNNSLVINEEHHYKNITRTRVMSRTISDWELVAEGVVVDE